MTDIPQQLHQDLAKLTVPLLKARCKELGLLVGGKKADLIARIQAANQAGAPTVSGAATQLPPKRPAPQDQDGREAPSKAPRKSKTKAVSATVEKQSQSSVTVAVLPNAREATSSDPLSDVQASVSSASYAQTPISTEQSVNQHNQSESNTLLIQTYPGDPAKSSAVHVQSSTTTAAPIVARAVAPKSTIPVRKPKPKKLLVVTQAATSLSSASSSVRKSLAKAVTGSSGIKQTVTKNIQKSNLVRVSGLSTAKTFRPLVVGVASSTDVAATPPLPNEDASEPPLTPANVQRSAANSLLLDATKAKVVMRRPLHTPSSLKNQHLPQTIPQKSTTKSSPARCLPTSLPTPKRAFKPLIGHPVEPAVSEPRADSRTISNYWINPPAPFQVAEFSTCMTQLPRTDDYPFVHVLALVLSRTDYQTLGKCERVSKLWMTAASKSWILLLEKDFGGPDASDRVEVASYADPKTHKVLYRFRYVQYFANLKHHCSSFIGRLYIRSLGCAPTAVLRAPYMCGIHLDLMKGSNSEKLRIARRFWIALFLREAQRYRDHDLVWGLPSVRNVELLTSDMSRVWTAPACIRLGSSDSEFVRPASYLVCTQTGDILTWLDPGTPGLPEPWQWLVDVCHARIGHSTTSDTLPHASAFLSLVLTKDTDFPQDIHRSVPRTGYHDLVAFRTVLAHCEDIDPSLTAGYERKAPTPRLITHEFRGAVQSIHFHSAPGRQRRQRHEVCADLALVHTVDRGTLYVLVETGHSIGDEQGGISPLWQNILQCDQDACGSLDTDDPADAMWATVGPHAMHIAQTYLRNTTAEPITHTSLMSGPVADYYAARSMEEVCRE